MNKNLKQLSDLISFHKQLPTFEGLGFSSHEINVGDKKRTYNAKDIEGYPSKLTEEIANTINETEEQFDQNRLTKDECEIFSCLYYYWRGESLEDYVNSKKAEETGNEI